MKTQYAYAIKQYWDGEMQPNSVHWSRKQCIAKFLSRRDYPETWQAAYKDGYRCVKVQINLTK